MIRPGGVAPPFPSWSPRRLVATVHVSAAQQSHCRQAALCQGRIVRVPNSPFTSAEGRHLRPPTSSGSILQRQSNKTVSQAQTPRTGAYAASICSASSTLDFTLNSPTSTLHLTAGLRLTVTETQHRPLHASNLHHEHLSLRPPLFLDQRPVFGGAHSCCQFNLQQRVPPWVHGNSRQAAATHYPSAVSFSPTKLFVFISDDFNP